MTSRRSDQGAILHGRVNDRRTLARQIWPWSVQRDEYRSPPEFTVWSNLRFFSKRRHYMPITVKFSVVEYTVVSVSHAKLWPDRWFDSEWELAVEQPNFKSWSKVSFFAPQQRKYTRNSSGDELANVNFLRRHLHPLLRSAPGKLPNSVK